MSAGLRRPPRTLHRRPRRRRLPFRLWARLPLLPSGSGLSDTAELINSAWQKEFSLFFSVEEVEPEEFQKRLENSGYTIALAPVQAEGGSIYTALAQFSPHRRRADRLPATPFTPPALGQRHSHRSARCSLLAA